MTSHTMTSHIEATRDQLMRAGRHLSAHRFARVANQWTSGSDLRQCTKGRAAEALACLLCCGSTYERRAPKAPEPARLAAVLSSIRTAPNTRGKTAATVEDRPHLERRIGELTRRHDKAKATLARRPAWVGLKNEIADCDRQIAVLTDVLATVAE